MLPKHNCECYNFIVLKEYREDVENMNFNEVNNVLTKSKHGGGQFK